MAINSKYLDEKELLEFISKELPRIIVERPEIRYEIIGIVSDQFAEKNELAQILSEIKTLREDFQTEMEASRKEFHEKEVNI